MLARIPDEELIAGLERRGYAVTVGRGGRKNEDV